MDKILNKILGKTIEEEVIKQVEPYKQREMEDMQELEGMRKFLKNISDQIIVFSDGKPIKKIIHDGRKGHSNENRYGWHKWEINQTCSSYFYIEPCDVIMFFKNIFTVKDVVAKWQNEGIFINRKNSAIYLQANIYCKFLRDKDMIAFVGEKRTGQRRGAYKYSVPPIGKKYFDDVKTKIMNKKDKIITGYYIDDATPVLKMEKEKQRELRRHK